MSNASFKELEQSGWVAKAKAYDGLLATITDQAIDPILESFGSLEHRRFLDVACGTGHLAGRAAGRGANSAMDIFAELMPLCDQVKLEGWIHPEGAIKTTSSVPLPGGMA